MSKWTIPFIIAVGVLLALAHPRVEAAEGDFWLTTGVWSRHDEGHYRQNNSGFGVSYTASEDISVVAGNYMNSLNRPSDYVGFAWQPLHAGDFKLGMLNMLVNGYTVDNSPVPVAVPALSYEHDRVGFNVLYVPTVVIAVQLKVKLW